MLDNCKHIKKLNIARDHSILNPQKWICSQCGTTESIWACLSCSHVACGRYVAEHALQHFTETKHPVVMDINEKYVFCYVCDEYVLNDNPQGDIKLLRSILTAITTQQFEAQETRSGRILRSSALTMNNSKQRLEQLKHADNCYTALVHRRLTLLTKMLSAWKRTSGVAAKQKIRLQQEETRLIGQQKKEHRLSLSIQNQQQQHRTQTQKPPPSSSGKRRGRDLSLNKDNERKTVITPGVTGLRNLGNTCYMNSILQVLGHLVDFRDCFLNLDFGNNHVKNVRSGTPSTRSKLYHRQTTMECLELISNPRKGSSGDGVNVCTVAAGLHQRTRHSCGGLNGGACQESDEDIPETKTSNSTKLVNKQSVSLVEEIHALFRVMWSGKCAMVSPQGILNSVWKLIPSFRGYSQQDAQEFLCELLDKIQSEMIQQSKYLCYTLSPHTHSPSPTHTHSPSHSPTPTPPHTLLKPTLTAVSTATNSFQGQLISEVICQQCQHVSSRLEPFWDLSLEFPERYQIQRNTQLSQYPCDLTEMLTEFTKVEMLDGYVYHCDNCNSKRRRSSGKQEILTCAQKRLSISQLPHILRLHLKRFRWSGRYREKISVHVNFKSEMNVVPYCHTPPIHSSQQQQQHSNADNNIQLHTLLTVAEQSTPEGGSTQTHSIRSDTQTQDTVTRVTDPSIITSGGTAVTHVDTQSHKLKTITPSSPEVKRSISGQVKPSKCPVTDDNSSSQCIYDLSAVVMHHGRGFGCGHYTSYVWNSDHGFWIHCNDARLQLCSIEDVTQAQAYILFYTRRIQQQPQDTTQTSSTTQNQQQPEQNQQLQQRRQKRRLCTSSDTNGQHSNAKIKRNTL